MVCAIACPPLLNDFDEQEKQHEMADNASASSHFLDVLMGL